MKTQTCSHAQRAQGERLTQTTINTNKLQQVRNMQRGPGRQHARQKGKGVKVIKLPQRSVWLTGEKKEPIHISRPGVGSMLWVTDSFMWISLKGRLRSVLGSCYIRSQDLLFRNQYNLVKVEFSNKMMRLLHYTKHTLVFLQEFGLAVDAKCNSYKVSFGQCWGKCWNSWRSCQVFTITVPLFT